MEERRIWPIHFFGQWLFKSNMTTIDTGKHESRCRESGHFKRVECFLLLSTINGSENDVVIFSFWVDSVHSQWLIPAGLLDKGTTLLFCMFVFNSRLERFYRHSCIYKCAGPCNHEWISTSSFHQWANRRYFHFHFCIDFHLFNYRRLSWHPSICLSFCLPVCLYKILCIKTSIRLIVDQTLVFINKHIHTVYAALLVSIKKDNSLNWNTFLWWIWIWDIL